MPEQYYLLENITQYRLMEPKEYLLETIAPAPYLTNETSLKVVPIESATGVTT